MIAFCEPQSIIMQTTIDTSFLGKFNCATGVVNVLYHDKVKDILVRTSTIKDILLIDKLQKENSNAVGFIPNSYFEKAVYGGVKNSVLLICEANNDAVGYVYLTPGMKPYSYAKIQQIAVRNDARRLAYGTALLDVCRQFCEMFMRSGFTLRCRQDLESNHFWKALGFEHYDTWAKGRVNHSGFKASDDINMWKIDLNSQITRLFIG